MVKIVSNLAEFQKEIQGPGLVVVDFFADWCGPCKMIAPVYEQLAAKYPQVKLLKVNVDQASDIAQLCRITAMPTFNFYKAAVVVDTVKGADARVLEAKIQQHKVETDPFAGKGQTLSSAAGASSAAAAPALSSREARLKAFGHMDAKPVSTGTSATSSTSTGTSISKLLAEAEDDDEALAKAVALSMAESQTQTNASPAAAPAAAASTAPAATSSATNTADDDMIPVPVDTQVLENLLDMGFTDVRARKAIIHGRDLEGALAWLNDHQDDPDIDQPYMVRRADAEKEAKRATPLTEEEKAAKIKELQEKAKRIRLERERKEKEEEIKREKERRERGQKIETISQEREQTLRKLELAKARKEKEDEKKERERLRAEIARDKELRKLNAGVLPSVLGVDGYNPSAIKYDAPMPAAPKPSTSSSAAAAAPAPAPTATKSEPVAKKPTLTTVSTAAAPAVVADPKKRIDLGIQMTMKYRTGGDGGNALRLLITFLKNLVENPNEPKFKSINCDSNAFKTKITPLAGPLDVLLAVGFEKQADGKLLYNDSTGDSSLLSSTLQRLTEAESLYRQQNPV